MSEEMTEGAVEETTATPEAEAPDATPTETPTWTQGIEDEKVKNLAGRYTTPAAMANALYEANRELSQRVKMPGEDASDEDRAKFNKQMGVPDSVDDYKITAPEGVDAELFQADEYQAPIKEIVGDMHKAGASQAVVDAMLTKYFQFEGMAKTEQTRLDNEYMQKAEADLRKEWGSGYDENIAFANDFLRESPQLAQLELRDGSLLGSHPAFVQRMAEVGRMHNEGQLKFGVAGSDAATDIQAQYEQLSRDMHAAYQSGDRSRAATLSAQRAAIGEKLHGTQSIVGAGRSI
jgi:hypothetical protein